MLDLRPVGHLIGSLLVVLGCSMLLPMLADLLADLDNWLAFALAAAVTVFIGVSLVIACRDTRGANLSIRQTFVLTVLIWFVSPLFAALPLMFGAPDASAADAIFEAVSGVTTTGATVFSGLDHMPPGVLLWRAMLQWFGGLGIIVVAMAFLPALRVGGMQLFKSEAFDTFGKILPRAGEIAASLSWLYIGLTVACTVAYTSLGMTPFDAVCHAMTTIATGGFANSDASFGAFSPSIEYVSVFFMLVASLPLVRLVQFVAGSARPLMQDSQVQVFLATAAVIVAVLVLFRMLDGQGAIEPVVRRTLFNAVSLMTGTGYASEDYGLWGEFAVVVLFVAGLIGGCAGSATCAVKVFRFQILAAAVVSQVREIHRPSGIFPPMYDGRPVAEDIIGSVMTFFYMFGLTLAVVTVSLSMMGLDAMTAISGAATALANVGPGFGPIIGPSGNFAPLPDEAKWLLSFTMLLGRLELIAVFILFTVSFWRG